MLSHSNHRTVKWGPREPVRMTKVMPKPKTYIFEWRLWERILSRVGQVSFACSPSKVAAWVWNLTVGTHVSSLVTQGRFGQIRSGCLVAINSPPPYTIIGGCSELVHGFCRLRATHLRSIWERDPCEDKAQNTQSPKSVWHHWSISVRVIWRLITLEDCDLPIG